MNFSEIIVSSGPKKEEFKLPKALVKYNNRSFGLQQKARFLYYLIFSLLGCVTLIVAYTFYINSKNPASGIDHLYNILLPELGMFIVILTSFFFLVRGHFGTAAHLLLISVLTISWTVMVLDRNDILTRLDTIVFVVAGLTILPLVIKRNKWVILLYIFVNIGVLLLFFGVMREELSIPDFSALEFICDTSLAILFIGIVSYNIFRINKITQEKAASEFAEKLEFERALNESEGRYRALMESMNEVIIVADNDHIVKYVNKQFTEKLGYTPEEIVGKVGYKMLHDPEDLKIVENANTDRINDKKTVYELTFKAKDGHKIDFLVSGAPYKNFVGKTIGSIGALMDITERKKTEKALNESQRQFQTLAQMSPVGIFRTNADGYTTYVNPKWSEISGLSFEEALGNGWLRGVHPDDIDFVFNKWTTDSNSNFKSTTEYRFLKPDGTVSWVLGYAVPEIVGGELRGYIGTITNITEVVAAQKELEKYQNHLEQLVYERTMDLESANEKLKKTNQMLDQQRQELQNALNDLQDAQNKLIQAEKMASLGVLAAGVAHEINNPLNFINGGAIALDAYFKEHNKENTKELEPLIDAIRVGVHRAAEIVSSLNLYSRRDDLPGTACNIHAIIDSCLVMLNNEIKYKAEVIKEYTKSPISVFGNAGRLHQVFLNVLTNAIQAITENGVIKISTQNKADHCIVSISDNGCGMSSDLITKIADPFFTTKDPGKGTGLGLSISCKIVKDYNGNIEFESEPGKGTIVIITMPLIK